MQKENYLTFFLRILCVRDRISTCITTASRDVNATNALWSIESWSKLRSGTISNFFSNSNNSLRLVPFRTGHTRRLSRYITMNSSGATIARLHRALASISLSPARLIASPPVAQGGGPARRASVAISECNPRCPKSHRHASEVESSRRDCFISSVSLHLDRTARPVETALY